MKRNSKFPWKFEKMTQLRVKEDKFEVKLIKNEEDKMKNNHRKLQQNSIEFNENVKIFQWFEKEIKNENKEKK